MYVQLTVCIDKGSICFLIFENLAVNLKLKIDFWDSKTCPSIQNWILAPKVKTGEILEIRGFVADRLQLKFLNVSNSFDVAAPNCRERHIPKTNQ